MTYLNIYGFGIKAFQILHLKFKSKSKFKYPNASLVNFIISQINKSSIFLNLGSHGKTGRCQPNDKLYFLPLWQISTMKKDWIALKEKKKKKKKGKEKRKKYCDLFTVKTFLTI